jgi:hypothetical protein
VRMNRSEIEKMPKLAQILPDTHFGSAQPPFWCYR